MELLKIEEVAKRTGLTKRAIRYYEDIGLISAPERSQGGMRLYSEEDI
ncbi:MerR family transcriptional regulator [Paenibacillus sp. FSL H8-0548]|nr:MerR family transcriptional regulator [Paenibacillus sp. FSL H8-0548]